MSTDEQFDEDRRRETELDMADETEEARDQEQNDTEHWEAQEELRRNDDG